MKPNYKLVIIIVLTLQTLLTASQLMAAEDFAATLHNVDGVVYVVNVQKEAKLAYEGLTVKVGDTINTEKDSTVMLLFADKGQVALRPDSSFQVSEFHYEEAQPNDDNLVIKLLKGGLRSVTGFVGKRGNKDAYRLESATAAMGIRGTDYTARLCDTDCQAEQNKDQPVEPSLSGTIARVAELEGNLTVKRANGEVTTLSKLKPIFENDELTMGETGYALLVFTDESRILLQAGSSMIMKNYNYEQTKADNGVMVMNMLKGAARIVTGLIGKSRPDKVQFNTTTATIGIRGTAFDMVCGSGASSCTGELFVHMREGTTAIKTETFELVLSNGQTSYVASAVSVPIVIEQMPAFIKDNHNPVPEHMPVDTHGLSGKGGLVPTGLYVSVNDGKVVLLQEGKTVEVNKGEGAYATVNGTQPVITYIVPVFINNDPTLGKAPFVQGLCN